MEPGEIYTGADGSYNGYFRYGQCGDGVVRWVNILYHENQDNWSTPGSFVYKYADYSTNPLSVGGIAEIGWLPGYPTGSVVQLGIDPSCSTAYADKMFAAAYHRPMLFDHDETAPWTQIYCSGSGGYEGFYTSNGLNIMQGRSIAFTPYPDNRLVLGCGDFLGFVSDQNDLTGTSFKHMDPYRIGKDNLDTEVIGGEIYMVKVAPVKWVGGNSDPNRFGYDTIPDQDGDTQSRQTYVIARYDDNLGGMDGDDGYRWRFVSRGLDEEDATGSGFYRVSDIVGVDDSTMFAVVKVEYVGYMIFKGTKDAGTDEWSWAQWWSSTSLTNSSEWIPSDDPGVRSKAIVELLVIPGTTRLLALALYDDLCLFELSTEAHSRGGGFTPVIWINKNHFEDPPYWTDSRIARSLDYLTTFECDPDGETLYLCSSGQIAAGFSGEYEHPFHRYCGNVLRVEIPGDGSVPETASWECILNEEPSVGVYLDGIPFAAVDAAYWPDIFPVEARVVAENLPRIYDIEIHPDNPHRVFIGLRVNGYRANETFHPRNGVWEYSPDTGSWNQLMGGSSGEPSKGVTTLKLVPGDPSAMIAGSYGQEFFRVGGIAACSVPQVAGTALEAVYDTVDPLASQTLLMVEMSSTSGADLMFAEVDATSIGLGTVEFFDGAGGDWEEGDGIWTANLDGLAVSESGPVSLPVRVRDAEWNTYRGGVVVEVLVSAPSRFFRNDSPAFNVTYEGTPSGIASLDIHVEGSGTDEKRDIVMSQLGSDAEVMLFQNASTPDGIPQFYDRTYENFADPLTAPGPDHGPTTVADLDNDGLQDLIIPAGSSGEGLRFYRQGGPQDGDDLGKYILEETWNPLDAAEQLHTWKAVCGDYDGDGYADVYLCRAQHTGDGMPDETATASPDILLRNDTAHSGSFVDTTVEAGIADAELATIDAAWCDFDGDGDLDLAVAGVQDAGSSVFVYQQTAQTVPFQVVFPQDPANPDLTEDASSLVWGDVDTAGDLDLVVSTLGSGTVYGLLNGQFSSAPSELITPPAVASGIEFVDYDCDGDQDLLLLPGATDAIPSIGLNDAGSFSIATDVYGLNALTGSATGALLADFNDDGGVDVFMGRPQASNKFLSTGSAPTGDWVGIRLLDDSFGSRPVIGARVVVRTGENTDTSIIAGNGGNAQDDGVIRVGLDPNWSTPTPTCNIYWPSGHVTNYVDLSGDVGTVRTVYHQTYFAPGFEFTGTPRGWTEVLPYGVVNYVFRWRTTKQTDITQDKVNVDAFGGVELQLADSDVDVRQWSQVKNGTLVFYHELVWYDEECVVGNIPFTVTTGRGTTEITSATTILQSRVCTSNPDPGS